MQTMFATLDGAVQRLKMPAPDNEVLPGIPWGAFDELLTPAFWCGQAWQHQQLGTYVHLRLGHNLAEELAACLLGGFGMPADLGLAAFTRLREAGLLVEGQLAVTLERELSQPLTVGGRQRAYRFPRQKAQYLAKCLQQLSFLSEPQHDVALRDRLTELPGIGLKTASWIVRNHRASNAVAVLDLHIVRACRYIGLFPPQLDPQRHYRPLESTFLRFAEAIGVPVAVLDALIWDYMSRLSAMRLPLIVLCRAGSSRPLRRTHSASSLPTNNGGTASNGIITECERRDNLVA